MATYPGYTLSSGWKGILAGFGVNHQDVLRRAGLPEDLLSGDEVRVPAEQFFAFAQALEDAVDDPLFPIRLVDSMSAEWFSPPLFAALCSPNLAVAVERLSKFKPLIAPVSLLVERGEDGGLTIQYRWLQPALKPPDQMVGYEALFVARLARLGTRHPVKPSSVTMPSIPEQRAAFEDYLGARIQQGPFLTLRFSRADAERPFLTASKAMWEIFGPELRRRLADLEGNSTFETRTRAVLLEALPSGQVSVQYVARRLAVSSRTLQRRLQGEGTSYKDVVQQTRERLARHYLGQTQLTSSEIAYLLGFEEPSSFFRAFHEWTGETPEGHRQVLRSAG